jgi:hypothetical protein
VPKEARDALARVRAFVEADRGRGVGVTVQTTRIGLEGETRLCAEYAEPAEWARAYARVLALVEGVDLVRVVGEPCQKGARPPGTQKQEE